MISLTEVSVLQGLLTLGSHVWSTGDRVGCMGRATNSSIPLSMSADGRWMSIAIWRMRLSHTPTLGPKGILKITKVETTRNSNRTHKSSNLQPSYQIFTVKHIALASDSGLTYRLRTCKCIK